ncbi:MAG: cytochrome c oxidase assembly protein [Cellvibrionaceae bacterium]
MRVSAIRSQCLLVSIGKVLPWLLPAQLALAHDPLSTSPDERLPLTLGACLLFGFCLAYWVGAKRITPRLQHFLLFNATALIAVFALFGPMDAWAETSAAMHMAQHMLMMVVIAPLWVFARPLPQLLSLSPRITNRVWKPLLRLAAYPMLTAFLHGAVIWFWHAPRFYVLALENPWWHMVEHACFLLSAGLFWWSVLRSSQRNAPFAFLAVLFTLMHTGFLGALLTFANAPLYGEWYGAGSELQSQQLAGLIMWVVGGLPYLAAAAWIGLRWFQQLLRRTAVSPQNSMEAGRRQGNQ